MKYIVVSGGVLSGIGKGIVASSTGMLLNSLGFKVTSIKIDPYLNIDAGTMSPFEHGEVYVLDDGGECDLDLGNYERFIGHNLTRDNNITTGKIYNHVIEKERKGEYLGKTVQVVPHICDEIQAWIERVAKLPIDGDPSNIADICVIELGGTVGDIESMPFIEAIRQFQFRVGKENFANIHVSLVPVVGAVGEQKSKPTQQSVRELRALGISPDIIVCRSEKELEKSIREKIASFCMVSPDHVFSCHDVNNIYCVPLILQPQGLTEKLLKKFEIDSPNKEPSLKSWIKISERYTELSKTPSEKAIHIALVGKYTNLGDAYASVLSSLQHASLKVNERLVIDFVEASSLEAETEHTDSQLYQQSWKTVKSANGILIPGGFGDRGINGMINAVEYARTNKVPFLGICLGLQVSVIETCRNVLNWKDAHSSEFDEKTDKKVVIFMPEISKTHMGGTMRLGKRKSKFETTNCITYKLYGCNEVIEERHRHRYEVNPEYIEEIEAKSNLRFVAKDFETGKRMEIIEIQGHPYFVAVQYHPEFQSRPIKPSPPFVGLLLAASNKLSDWVEKKETSLKSSLG